MCKFSNSYIFSEISQVFYLKICLQLLILESSTMLKLIQECNSFVIKNGESLVDANLLLLTANLAIIKFFDYSSCW